MEIELSALIAASLRALAMIMVPAAFGYFFGRIHAKYFMGKEDPHVDGEQREMVAILLFRRVALFLLVLWLLFGAFQIRDHLTSMLRSGVSCMESSKFACS